MQFTRLPPLHAAALRAAALRADARRAGRGHGRRPVGQQVRAQAAVAPAGEIIDDAEAAEGGFIAAKLAGCSACLERSPRPSSIRTMLCAHAQHLRDAADVI